MSLTRVLAATLLAGPRSGHRQPTRSHSENGAELVEFALVLPVLLLMLLGLADFGFMLQAYGVVNNAAREGVRLSILTDQGYTTNDVKDRVAAYISEGLPAGSTAPATSCVANGPGICVADLPMSATCSTCSPPVTLDFDAKQVTVIYPYTYRFIGGIAGMMGRSYTTVNLRAVATMRTETPAH